MTYLVVLRLLVDCFGGLRAGWNVESLEQEDAYIYLKKAMEEWLEYYYFWYKLKEKNPKSIFDLSHSSVVDKGKGGFDLMMEFLNLDSIVSDIKIEKVSKSKSGDSVIDPAVVAIGLRIRSEYETDYRYCVLEAGLDVV